MQDGQYAVVVQSVRYNKVTGRSTLYVLGVKVAKTKDVADKAAEKLQKEGFVTDVLPVQYLSDLV